MAAKNDDLHGNVPDESDVVLLLIDVINDLQFEGRAPPGAGSADGGAWRSSRRGPALWASPPSTSTTTSGAGAPTCATSWPTASRKGPAGGPWCAPGRAGLLRAQAEALRLLLHHPGHPLTYLKASTLILAGITGDVCVLFTANDAFMRDFHLIVPADGCISIDPQDNAYAVRQMRALKARTSPRWLSWTWRDWSARTRRRAAGHGGTGAPGGAARLSRTSRRPETPAPAPAVNDRRRNAPLHPHRRPVRGHGAGHLRPQRLPLSTSLLYLAIGYAVGPGLGLLDLDPLRSSAVLERIAEVAVIVSLAHRRAQATPALDPPGPWPRLHPAWRPALRLATLSMVLTVALVAGSAWWLFDLPLGRRPCWGPSWPPPTRCWRPTCRSTPLRP